MLCVVVMSNEIIDFYSQIPNEIYAQIRIFIKHFVG